MIVSIKELQKNIFARFKQTTAGEFGITKIDPMLESESLAIDVQHYTGAVTYKISFNKILSYVVLNEYVQEVRDQVVYVQDFSSAILKQVKGTKYMEYLLQSTDLKIFFQGEALNSVKQYSVHSQYMMIDVITTCTPVIEVIA